MTPAAILDVDGTLVDSNYQHAIAWFRAFREHDVTPPIWRIHRHIGMGGDQLVAAVAGDEVEAEHGDAIRDAEGRFYSELIGEVCPFEGAAELIATLAGRGVEVVLASSAKEDEVGHYIELLDCSELISAYTTSDDVERTKPEPDLIHAALERIAAAEAVMVGDSTWDVEAARRADVPTIAVLTGGFSSAELEEAGAEVVYASVVELVDDLEATRFAAEGRG
jgi:phosphoglycolate phosphatase-like HAD superfamily hydrolase